ncbi:hypothetical protein NLS1_34740 [Nocardioides sp. LS1]|nr:hypothetical protein NLS1_34740 [Nocardioides sp. LS1]
MRVPQWPMFGAAVLAVAAMLIPFVSRQGIMLPSVGYALGAVGTPCFAVIHRVMLEGRSKSPWFVPSPVQSRVLALLLAVGLTAGLLNAWFLATELAKR